jgi:hypothetical protein
MNKTTVMWVMIIFLILTSLVFLFSRREEVVPKMEEKQKITSDLEKKQTLAENWIVNNSPTYLFDGSDLELLFEEKIGENNYRFIFSFNSNSAGYGDRSDQMSAQLITPHEIEIIIENGSVIKAVTDKVFDEMEGGMLE